MESYIEKDRDYAWRLYTEVNNLVSLWHFYRELCVDINDERYETITEIAPNFYDRVLVETLSHSIVLAIARATDKRAKNKQDTISIYEILKYVPADKKENFKKLISDSEPQFKKIEKWRHQHLAHNGKDFDEKKLKMLNHELKEALNTMSEIINEAMKIFRFNNQVLDTDTDVIATIEIEKLFQRLKDNK